MKTGDVERHRGFESHLLRYKKRNTFREFWKVFFVFHEKGNCNERKIFYGGGVSFGDKYFFLRAVRLRQMVRSTRQVARQRKYVTVLVCDWRISGRVFGNGYPSSQNFALEIQIRRPVFSLSARSDYRVNLHESFKLYRKNFWNFSVI